MPPAQRVGDADVHCPTERAQPRERVFVKHRTELGLAVIGSQGVGGAVAEIIDNADKSANRLYRGPPRVYILEVVEGSDGAG